MLEQDRTVLRTGVLVLVDDLVVTQRGCRCQVALNPAGCFGGVLSAHIQELLQAWLQ